MADSSTSAASGAEKPKVAPKPVNPAFKALGIVPCLPPQTPGKAHDRLMQCDSTGMPNFRFKLPSRNWMIFLTITGSFAGAIIYDRREKRRAQQKWCDLVAHLATEPLAVEQMRRKLTVYLAAPPGDGIRVARDHFKEYVKPILTAAALDYTVVEGRREGDVRAGTAESIRKLRRKAGEPSSVVTEPTVESAVLDARERMGIQDEPGPKGDLVIGRHTWKEYVRGLHEGWLGPLDPPSPPVDLLIPEGNGEAMKDIATSDAPSDKQENVETLEKTLENAEKPEEKPEEKKEEKPKPTGPADAYIYPAETPPPPSPPSLPQSFDNSVPVEFPHVLGFLNTPIRLWRYLNERHMAENIGRQVASAVLAASSRPYRDESFSTDSEFIGAAVDSTPSRGSYEQQSILEVEEKEWHKSVHKREDADKEREWLDDIVLDPRIASRMQTAMISPEDEARAQRIFNQEEYILGQERPAPVPFWKHLWIKYGYGEDEETIRRKPILPNVDEEHA
ncbi:Mitochondrial import inner membrane translocase subunit Tim54 [Penicillium maclennaniae]|uniref:Mitochondrial import inner membrane translocase subunit Tim54 n=1 Tax=Penicillium maclennaniae TaxID=1343394 RepID=UPI0025402938|nr:Mitochondrial import inner membrane translocase subunit Tim54 [Penicillium maclennaniae]KAJ5665992.1 Mitochondrial import inner membrane translocase subunit Tim54 [Penicillium maclennaniae]